MDNSKKNLSIDEISNRIIDTILAETYLEKESLKEAIRPVLKIWLKNTDGVKKYRGKSTDKAKLHFTQEQKRVSAKFWLDALREEIGEDNVKPYYDKHNQHLKDEGVLDYSDWEENKVTI